MVKSDIKKGGSYAPTEVGKTLYLWSGGSREDAAMISAHGIESKCEAFKVPEGMTIYFYNPHGYTLQDPGAWSMATGKLKPREWYGAAPGSKGAKCPDYSLSKYQGRHGGEKGKPAETYEDIGVKIHRSYQEELINTSFTGHFRTTALSDVSDVIMDIISIRNRSFHSDPALHDVVELIKGYGYKELHCSFCRGHRVGPDLGKWDARTNT